MKKQITAVWIAAFLILGSNTLSARTYTIVVEASCWWKGTVEATVGEKWTERVQTPAWPSYIDIRQENGNITFRGGECFTFNPQEGRQIVHTEDYDITITRLLSGKIKVVINPNYLPHEHASRKVNDITNLREIHKAEGVNKVLIHKSDFSCIINFLDDQVYLQKVKGVTPWSPLGKVYYETINKVTTTYTGAIVTFMSYAELEALLKELKLQ